MYKIASLFYNGELNNENINKYNIEFNSDVFYSSIKDNQSKKRTQSEILSSIIEILIIESCPTDKFIEQMTLDIHESYNYYKWPGLKYFLACWEINRFNDMKNLKLSSYFEKRDGVNKSCDLYEKEHIWALNNRLIEKRKGIGEEIRVYKDNIDVHEKARLGNFILLYRRSNVQVRDYDLSNKFKDNKIDINKLILV